MNRKFAIFFVAMVTAILSGPEKQAFGENVTPFDDKSAVIFAYHRIGEDQFPETNIRKEQFEAHIREIAGGEYNVLPLSEIISALKEERTLPARTIALTFDGGHRSVLENAVPLLLKHNLPFTIFFSTDKADWDSPAYLNWQDLKKLARNRNVTLGVHPAAYKRIFENAQAEITTQINNAKSRYREILGENPRFFAYPFGEHSLAYKETIERNGFSAAFGQQSAVTYPGADFYALPRFSMTENFADLERFRLIANALPLPVSEIEPADPLLAAPTSSIGFTVTEFLRENNSALACFSSDPGEPAVEIIGDNRVELRLAQPFESSRVRINCTMPGPSVTDPEASPRWRWFGLLLTMSSNAPEAAIDETPETGANPEQAALQPLQE